MGLRVDGQVMYENPVCMMCFIAKNPTGVSTVEQKQDQGSNE